jgi:hypothetical protein
LESSLKNRKPPIEGESSKSAKFVQGIFRTESKMHDRVLLILVAFAVCFDALLYAVFNVVTG